MHRRTFLGALAATTGTVGASPGTSATDARQPTVQADDVAYPTVDDRTADDWTLLGREAATYTRTVLFFETAVRAGTLTYWRTRRVTLPDGGRRRARVPLAAFFASRLEIGGVPGQWVSADVVADAAYGPFADRLATYGVHDLTRVEPRTPLPDAPSVIRAYRGRLDLSEAVAQVGDDADAATLGDIPGSIPVRVLYGVWKPDVDTALVAGGVYPVADPGTDAVVTADGAGENATRLELGRPASAFRQELVTLMDSVSV